MEAIGKRKKPDLGQYRIIRVIELALLSLIMPTSDPKKRKFTDELVC
jgi:hypothetical protein